MLDETVAIVTASGVGAGVVGLRVGAGVSGCPVGGIVGGVVGAGVTVGGIVGGGSPFGSRHSYLAGAGKRGEARRRRSGQAGRSGGEGSRARARTIFGPRTRWGEWEEGASRGRVVIPSAVARPLRRRYLGTSASLDHRSRSITAPPFRAARVRDNPARARAERDETRDRHPFGTPSYPFEPQA